MAETVVVITDTESMANEAKDKKAKNKKASNKKAKNKKAKKQKVEKQKAENEKAKIQDIVFPLLNLPAEIWSKIAKLAVTYDEPVMLFAERKCLNNTLETTWFALRDYTTHDLMRWDDTAHDQVLCRQQPPITRVCRALREECLTHYYSANIFCGLAQLPFRDMFLQWLLTVGESKFALEKFYYITNEFPGRFYGICRGDFKLQSRLDPSRSKELMDLFELDVASKKLLRGSYVAPMVIERWEEAPVAPDRDAWRVALRLQQNPGRWISTG